MNKVVLSGNLVRDVESWGEGDKKVAKYTLAVNRRKDGTDFIPCVCFGRTAEFAEKYLAKGKKVMIAGRIQTGSYEKDGQKVYTTEIIVEDHEFCEKRGFDIPDSVEDLFK